MPRDLARRNEGTHEKSHPEESPTRKYTPFRSLKLTYDNKRHPNEKTEQVKECQHQKTATLN